MKDLELEQAMWRATHTQLGVEVHTDNVDALRRKFYALRKQEPGFACLSTALPPNAPPGVVWIIKQPETPNAPSED